MTNDETPTAIEPGLLGYCDLIHDMMTAQGWDGDVDELRVISGAALQHYIYEPSYNSHEDVRREFSKLALLFNNFGFFESLRFFTGWNVRDFDGVSLVDAMKLATYEAGQGRLVFTVDLVGDLEPALIVSIDGPRLVTARVRNRGRLEERRVDLSNRKNLQHDQSFQNFFVMVRQSEGEESLVGPNRQRLELLRWVAAHHGSEKEFFHETRENYASGDRAFQRLSELQEQTGEAESLYVDDHFRFLEVGRAAAGRVLERWGHQLGERLDSTEVERGLTTAAKRYADAAAAASERSMNDLKDLEAEAVASIRSTFPHLPGRFEPID